MQIVKWHNIVVTLLVAMTLGPLLMSCKKESNPVGPPDSRPIMTVGDYGKIVLTMSDYDVVRVTHQMGLDLRSPDIVRFGVGTKDSLGYRQLLSVPTTYDVNAQAFIIHFDAAARMDSTKTVASLTVRYYHLDSSFSDVDTIVALCKFPYNSVEVFVTSSIMIRPGDFQDIARTDSFLYFHPLGADGAYQFDVSRRQTTSLLDYNAGNHICADSTFVFFDIGDNYLYRYNLLIANWDRRFPSFPGSTLCGLDVLDGRIYALFSGSSYYLKVYTFEGAFIDSIAYPRTHGYYMALYDSIVYSVEYVQMNRTFQLSRFDLRTQEFLPNALAPARWTEGIKTHGGLLYFVDYYKRVVGVMPISDLKVAQ